MGDSIEGWEKVIGRKLNLSWFLKVNQLQQVGDRILMPKDAILGKRTNVSRLHFIALEDPAAYETFSQAYLRQFYHKTTIQLGWLLLYNFTDVRSAAQKSYHKRAAVESHTDVLDFL